MSRCVMVYRPDHPKADKWGHVDTRDLGEEPAAAPHVAVVGDSHYDGLRATDGTPINTRRRHREYMARNGLTTVDDYTQAWKQGEKVREQIRSGEYGKKERREAIGRAAYEYEKRKRKNR